MGLRQRKNDRDRTTRRGNRTLDDVQIVDGELVNVMKVPRQQPVEEYLKQQRRFAHLFKMPGGEAQIKLIQDYANYNLERYKAASPVGTREIQT